MNHSFRTFPNCNTYFPSLPHLELKEKWKQKGEIVYLVMCWISGLVYKNNMAVFLQDIFLA